MGHVYIAIRYNTVSPASNVHDKLTVYKYGENGCFLSSRVCSMYMFQVAPRIPILLVGCDTYKREVEYEMAVDFARERGVAVVEVSEGDRDNESLRVELALMMLVARCLHSHEKSTTSTAKDQ